MKLSITMQIDSKDILKYVYTPTLEVIDYDHIEQLQAAIEKFILYTLDMDQESTGEQAARTRGVD